MSYNSNKDGSLEKGSWFLFLFQNAFLNYFLSPEPAFVLMLAVLMLDMYLVALIPGKVQVEEERRTWLDVRTKKGSGTGLSAELGHSSSDISAMLSRKPPPGKGQKQSC